MTDRELLKLAEKQVDAKTPCDEFENAIRKFGIINACEWFNHSSSSEFTAETIAVLAERHSIAKGKRGEPPTTQALDCISAAVPEDAALLLIRKGAEAAFNATGLNEGLTLADEECLEILKHVISGSPPQPVALDFTSAAFRVGYREGYRLGYPQGRHEGQREGYRQGQHDLINITHQP